ncbi:hypothetical protein GGF32_004699 [Allomyces javanicus]|nr:hypothetical protein GGF32_004699 [Allomyces javanicus]
MNPAAQLTGTTTPASAARRLVRRVSQLGVAVYTDASAALVDAHAIGIATGRQLVETKGQLDMLARQTDATKAVAQDATEVIAGLCRLDRLRAAHDALNRAVLACEQRRARQGSAASAAAPAGSSV